MNGYYLLFDFVGFEMIMYKKYVNLINLCMNGMIEIVLYNWDFLRIVELLV